jgi:hypothetical protein
MNKKYKQTKNVHWLKTPKGTIWKTYGFNNYIQPEDENLWESPFGVDLDLLIETEDENLFELINEKYGGLTQFFLNI